MNDPISKRAALDIIDSELNGWLTDDERLHIERVGMAIEDLPIVYTVKHGKWVNDKGLYKCTACNDHCTVAGWADCIPEEQMYKVFKFCPNCGAKMERSENGET